MDSLPALIETGQLPADLQNLIRDAQQLARESRAPNTRRAYAGAARRWKEWCAGQGIDPLPAQPAAVALYLTHLANTGRKAGTLDQTLAALAYLHRAAGLPFDPQLPPITSTLDGIRRRIGSAHVGKAALVIEDIRRLIAACPRTPAGLRDRALIMVGFGGALRRSELIGLDLGERRTGTGHVETCAQGLEVHIARSKTDQHGKGETVPIKPGAEEETCPVAALADWVAVAGIKRGDPVFVAIDRHGNPGGRLSGHAVADIIKRACQRAGLDPARFSGHSLRSGHVTTAADAGAPEDWIQAQTRHKKVDTLRTYIKRVDRWRKNSSGYLGY